MRGKVTRQCPQTTTFEKKGELKRIRTETPPLTSLMPYPRVDGLHLCFCLRSLVFFDGLDWSRGRVEKGSGSISVSFPFLERSLVLFYDSASIHSLTIRDYYAETDLRRKKSDPAGPDQIHH